MSGPTYYQVYIDAHLKNIIKWFCTKLPIHQFFIFRVGAMDSLGLGGMNSYSGKERTCFHLLIQQSHWRLHLSPPINPRVDLASDLAPLVRLVPPTVLHWQTHQRAFPGYLDLNVATQVKEAETIQHYGTTNNFVNRLRGDQKPASWYHALIGIANSAEICFYTQLISTEIFLHQIEEVDLPIKFT